ncbi:hypothetical protein L195_g028126, partial [Trifolium pratense]
SVIDCVYDGVGPGTVLSGLALLRRGFVLEVELALLRACHLFAVLERKACIDEKMLLTGTEI